ncbi:hypothetical protein KKF91_04015 [Myxococcota bacterium]|nr:hypothetical protein [Myxococcota bacterium]MBU1429710.1 hypothetical protein [Myxococcota bacterium]MBU1899802.1 hypothetical protein [Myxococcota bacterium]
MPRLAPLALALALLSPGCVTYWQGQEMSAKQVALEARMDQLVDDQRAQREKMKTDLQGIIERFSALEQGVTSAIEGLRSNTADAGLIIDQLRAEIATLKGKLEEAKKVAAQEDGLPNVEQIPGAPQLPTDSLELYRYGYERRKAKDCPEAVRALIKFARSFPKDKMADNALYLVAICLNEEGKFADSLRVLDRIQKSYKSGDKVDDALVLMHDNFISLGQCKNAIPFLEILLNEHPTSKLAAEVEAKLKRTRRGCK